MLEPLSIQLQPSGYLRGFLLGLAVLSYLAVLTAGLPALVTVILVIVVSCYSFFLWRRYISHFIQHHPSGIYYRDRQWCLTVAGKAVAVELHESLVWTWLAVAQYRCPLSRRVYPVVLLPDSCDREGLRRLSVLWRSTKAFAGNG